MKKALKEKLVKLIHYCTSCEECRDEDIADHLIANGVTVQGESFVPQIMCDRIKYHIDLQKWVHQVLFKIGDKEWEYCTDLPTELVSEAMVPEWISVKDRLPENDYGTYWKDRKQYLVHLQNGTMRVARYGYKEYDWWIGSQDVVLHEKHYTCVTHWMPCNLPQQPKGE